MPTDKFNGFLIVAKIVVYRNTKINGYIEYGKTKNLGETPANTIVIALWMIAIN